MAPSIILVVAIVVAIVAGVYAMKLKKKVDEYGRVQTIDFGNGHFLKFFWTDETGRIRTDFIGARMIINSNDDQGMSVLFTNNPELENLLGR